MVLLAGLGAGAACLALFADLAEDVARQETAAMDYAILHSLAMLRTPRLTRLMVLITAFGDAHILVVVSLLAVAALLRARRRVAAVMVIVVGGGALLLNLTLKGVFQRPRPPLAFEVARGSGPVSGYAFPSGHTMVSFCIYGFLAYLALRSQHHPAARAAAAVAYVLLIGAIGFSRLYLGVHWPTDVAAGYLAGAIWLAASITALWGLERRQPG